VDVHVKRLREALGAAGPMVETVRGAGYRLTAKPLVPLQPALSAATVAAVADASAPASKSSSL
jgi:two-component system phosphate regulon response regulator PhoB